MVGGRVSEAYWNQSNQVNGRKKRQRRRASRRSRMRATSTLRGDATEHRKKKPKVQPRGGTKKLRYRRTETKRVDGTQPVEHAVLAV